MVGLKPHDARPASKPLVSKPFISQLPLFPHLLLVLPLALALNSSLLDDKDRLRIRFQSYQF